VASRPYFAALLTSHSVLWIDRNFTVKGDIPAELKNTTIIHTAMDDKIAQDPNFLSFEVGHACLPYILLGSENKAPSWLSASFDETELQIGVNWQGQTHLRVWKSKNVISVNTKVTFGGAEFVQGGGLNYLVLLKF